MTSLYQSIALLNLAICMCILWSCICRLNAERCKKQLGVRVKYTLLLAGSVSCGLSPALWNDWPSFGTLSISIAILVYLVLSIPAGAIKHNRHGGDI